MQLASLSIDMDPLGCYHSLHGIPDDAGAPERLADTTLHVWLDLLKELGIHATFFLVGSATTERHVREIIAAGHEVGNHTWSHPYAHAALSPDALCDEVARTHAHLTAKGAQVCGFRTPGYGLTADLVRALEDAGYGYSSSQLSSWSYMAAREGLRNLMRLKGRAMSSTVHPLTELLAPGHPYTPDPQRPWRRGQGGHLLEIPVSTGPSPLNLPATGGFLFLLGQPGLLTPSGGPLVLNFHGIELWSGAPLHPRILLSEFALRRPLEARLRLVRDAVLRWRSRYLFVPLREMAAAFRN